MEYINNQSKFVSSYKNNISLEETLGILMSMDQDLVMISALNKLEEPNKFLIAKTLLICLNEGDVNLSVFEEFPPNEWRKELLTFTLLSKLNSSDMEAIQLIITKINYLSDFLNNDSIYWNIEEILEILVCHQDGSKFNAQFLNDLLYIVPEQPDILLTLSKEISVTEKKIKDFKLQIISNSCKTAYGELVILQVLLYTLLKYPAEVIYNVCRKIEDDNLAGITTFLKILDCSDIDFTHKVRFLLRLEHNDNITEWIYKLSFVIIGHFISNLFPLYENNELDKNAIKDKAILNKICSPLSKEGKKTELACTCKNEEKCKLHQSTVCNDVLHILHCSLAQILSKSNEPSEIFKAIGEIISSINREQKIVQVINAIDVLHEYNIQFSDETLQSLLSKLTGENCEHEIHKYVVENSFPGTYEKSVDQLSEELKQLNTISTYSIIEHFSNIKIAYENNSELFPEGECIKSWNKSQIELWARVVRKVKDSVPDEELIAVIMRAAELTVGLKLRDIQLLSVIIMLRCTKGKGRLLQVNTGEGKTLIIAVAAAFYVLKGHQVDVFTSSKLLAKPQSEKFQDFYLACEITVSHNIDNSSSYECDVIYGTNNSFQADVLRDEFRKSGIRKGRKFDIAIVDEVDNMLIDGNNWILMLSCDMPAMDYLETVLAAIFIQVNAVASVMTERNGKVYYLEQESALDENGNIKPEVIVNEREIEGTKMEFITKCVETHIRKLIRDTDSGVEIEEGYEEIKIPKHLREIVCKTKLKKWIQRAIWSVFHYIQNEDYILKDGKVTIVDTKNTGVIKKNSHWSHGLHQFLEIKHGGKIEPESFTTNFLSNVGLFTRYSSRIFGLTGTLGSCATKEFLQKTYDVDSVVIPPFKLKQHKHLEPIIVKNEEMWYLEIAKNSIRKLRNGRAALIIMKFIRETEKLAEVFEKSFNYDKSKIKLYRTDDDSKVVASSLNSGDVVITTNIAGRGTDIELQPEVEKNGGLHVCLTFLPVNSRVEEQNIGRTSRKGNRGTSQLILHDSGGSSIQTLKRIRSLRESAAIRGATEQVKNIKTKDRIFEKFCNLLGEIKGRNSYVQEVERTAVEERFAIWLEANEDQFDEKSEKEIFQDFKVFSDEISNDDRNGKLIKNPCMFVEIGNKYLKDKKFGDAIDEYTSAIDLDDNFAEHAYYNRAWARLSKYGKDLEENEYYIDKAISDFRKARKLIEEKEYGFHLLQHASKGEVLLQQISHKANLYNFQKNVIEMAIGPDVDAINEQIKKLEKELEKDITKDEKDKISEIIENLKKNKENIGVIGRARENKRDIKIENLTDDEFMPKSDRESHQDEIEEFERNGWIRGFKITEVKPINWKAVVSLIGIGLGQLIIGAALTVFTLGAGASIGMGLISEGVSDLITAVKDGIINRSFDWATWALQKVISISVSIVCAGLKAIKDVARTAYTGAKNVALGAKHVFSQTAKEGWKIVAKRVGLDLAKGVAKEIVTDLVNYGIDKTLIPMIEEKIIELVRDPIQEALTNNPKVKTMFELDLKNKNHNYENYIRSLGTKILNPANNSKIKNIAMQIATRVADNKGLSTVRQIGTAIHGIYELSTFTTDFIKKMNESIDKVKIKAEEESKGPKVSNDQKADEQINARQREMSEPKEGDIDLSKVKQSEEQVQLQQKMHTTNNLSDELAGMVSTNMINIIKGKMISPVIQFGANYTVEKFCSQINTSLNEQTENYKSFKRVLHHQNKGYENTKKNEPKKVNTSEIDKVDELIKDVESGGPAGLLHLGAMSDAANRPIEVYDEKGKLKFIVGDTKKGPPVQIQYHPPDNGSENGHFTLKGNREPVNKGKGSNMCAFDVVAEQIGQNPNDLKTSTLNIMEKNKSTIAKQVKDIKRLEAHQSSRLLKGGAQYDGKCPDDAAKLLEMSDGKKGHGNNNKGHPFEHVPFRGKTDDRLNAVSEELKRKIEVYDKDGNKLYTLGDNYDGEPIKLQYNKPEGDTSGEYFTAIGGQESYHFHDPNDMTFYDIAAKQHGESTNAADLKSATLNKINNIPVPEKKPSVEWASTTKKSAKKEGEKDGFMSAGEQAYVTHHALLSEAGQKKLAELNKHINNPNNPEICKSVRLILTMEELNLPRQVFGGKWKNGKLVKTYPVEKVYLQLQHFRTKENVLDAPVHIHTCYPYDPDPDAPPPPPPPSSGPSPPSST